MSHCEKCNPPGAICRCIEGCHCPGHVKKWGLPEVNCTTPMPPVKEPKKFDVPDVDTRAMFAAMAMQGSLSNPNALSAFPSPKILAKHCIECADALIESLSEKEDKS